MVMYNEYFNTNSIASIKIITLSGGVIIVIYFLTP